MDIVVDYFKNKTNGFFIEAGAWDGEWLSNTLFLEVCMEMFITTSKSHAVAVRFHI